jgi:epoxyqueuosine reductase
VSPEQEPLSLRERVEARAQALGFDAVGFARADEPLTNDYARYLDFVGAGRRLDTADILEGARTVICLARRYQRADDDADPPIAKLIARYARGQDYHNHLRKKVRALAKFVRTLGPDVKARPLCDEEPLLERAWAARSGLGFVGKNGLVIVPGQGSFVLLGEVVTTLALPPLQPMTERCGSCTRCLDACPTQAFDAPFVLDPRRCVAYLTIEAPLEEGLDEGPDHAEHLFGCDDCQTVCPFNRAPLKPSNDARPFRPLPVWSQTTLPELASLEEPRFAELTVGSPLHRAGAAGLARSASRILRARGAS